MKPKENTLCREFDDLLSRDPPEEDLHRFIVAHPILLFPFGGPLAVSKPSIGCDHTADFAVRTVGNGVCWTFVEIERSCHRLFTAKGLPTNALNTAIAQTQAWYHWLTSSSGWADSAFPGEHSAAIVIGRRATVSAVDRRRLQSLNKTSKFARVMTWETLADPFREKSNRYIRTLEEDGFPLLLSDAEYRAKVAAQAI